jgi:hypothetical protein
MEHKPDQPLRRFWAPDSEATCDSRFVNRIDLSRVLLLMIAIGISASGCRTTSGEQSARAPQVERHGAPEPAVDETVSASEPGTVPSAPLPRGTAVRLEGVEVIVAEFERGKTAERMLRAANPVNRPAPKEWEYVLLRLNLAALESSKSWVGCDDFRVIGEHRVAYFHSSQFPPAPELADRLLAGGERVDGWCVYRVRVDERNLILMISGSGARLPRERRYLALEPGASLPAPPATATPTKSAGESPLSAAAAGEEVLTQDWSVTAVEIRRGDAALRLVEDANPKNPAPAEGLEFVAVKLHARYRGRAEHPALLPRSAFRTIDRDGKPYPVPVVLDVTPRIGRTLLPGGEHTGWVVMQVARGDTRAVLRFQPLFPDRERRYFALTDGSRSGRAQQQ